MSSRSSESRFVGGSGDDAEPAALAAAIANVLEARAADKTLVAALSSRARTMALVAAALRTGRSVVFPHGFTPSVLASLVAEHEALLVHDRDGGEGLDLRSLETSSERIDPSLALHEARNRECLVFMTSGTTGAPKASRKTAAQLLDEAEALASTFGIEEGSVLALGIPSTHVFGFLFGIALPAVRSVVVHSELIRFASQANPAPTWFIGAPPTLRSFLLDYEGGSKLRVVSSGAALEPSLFAEAKRAGATEVFEIFGSTETGGIGFRTEPSAAFKALPSVELELGEPSRVKSAFTANRTIELGDRLEREGENFRFVERDADVVKIGARRISIGAVEAALRALPNVSDASVRARQAPGARGSRLAALVVSDASTEELRLGLSRTLDLEFLPRPLVLVPSIARSPSGKISHEAFERQLESGLRTARAGLSIRTEAERFVASIRADASRFEGHFPGEAILPGVSVLLDLVMPMVHSRFAELGWPSRLSRVKFVRPIRPGDTLVCALSRKRPDQIVFELSVLDGPKVGSGNIDFGALMLASRSSS